MTAIMKITVISWFAMNFLRFHACKSVSKVETKFYRNYETRRII